MSTRIPLMASLVVLLASCARPADEPAAAPAADEAAPAAESPAATPAPAETPGPDSEAPADPAPPAPQPPSPTEPSPAAKPTSTATGPAVDSMESARPTAKMGVPVELRYHFDSPPQAGQPATLHLAAVPRVSGSNLIVSVQKAAGIQLASSGELTAQKANASGAYRQLYSVTRSASGPRELRVLVTLDTAEGSTFGFFGIPLDTSRADGNFPQKLNSVKQP